jgi:tRNA(Arg) A34 adenosine deaminase TadA
MTHKDYVRLAIRAAKESELEGGAAIGSVLIRNGKVIAIGKSLVWQSKDPTGHAESNCIRNACSKFNILDLDNTILYGTLEPCGMCLSSAAWANIPEIYFGAYRKDVEPANRYEIVDWGSETMGKKIRLHSGKQMRVGGVFCEKNVPSSLKIMQDGKRNPKFTKITFQ